MVNPSHPGNVGSAARAIKTMGFSELVLVGPKFADVTSQPEAVALASGALDVLENARIYDTLEEALAMAMAEKTDPSITVIPDGIGVIIQEQAKG